VGSFVVVSTEPEEESEDELEMQTPIAIKRIIAVARMNNYLPVEPLLLIG
jgi:hypothetical protein